MFLEGSTFSGKKKINPKKFKGILVFQTNVQLISVVHKDPFGLNGSVEYSIKL